MSEGTHAPLEILVVAGRYPLGSETFVRRQCAGLLERGHRVEVLALAEGDGAWTGREREAGLPERTRCAHLERGALGRAASVPAQAVRLAARSPRALLGALSPALGARAVSGQLLAIADALGAPRRFDAIHCQFGPAGLVSLLARRAGLIDGPITVAFYGYDVTRFPRTAGARAYDALFREAALLLPISDDLGARLVALGAPPAKVRTHRLGVDLALFEPADRSTRRAAPVALAVGRFVEKKGFETLLRAFARIAPQTDLALRLVGDGPLRPRLEALVAELGIAARVDFRGWRTSEEVAREMADSDFLVAPSVTAADGDMEGAPLVILEALATGLPVVGSRHGGIPETVDDGATGLIVPERDEAALADALVRMSRADVRVPMAAAARASAAVRFDGRTQSAELEGMLRGLRDGRALGA
jgi:colanic acid/amylovoran biosynthesis glycosyltransferase